MAIPPRRPRWVRRASIGLWALAACGDPYPPPAPAAAAEAAAPAVAGAGRTPAEVRAAGNHLVGEPSPYLQQHAHNPIDWYPWSAEALALAAAQGKPIFVSIGYATCHWCHVMERESFDDDGIAAFLNANFIAIKVDREQRPDVDALYLAAVAGLGGDTGWPLNVFLTPTGVPIVGGTYYPPRPDGRRPGFLALAQQVHADWTAHGEATASRGRQVLDALGRRGAGDRGPAPTRADVDAAMLALSRHRDEVRGGFGTRQKFPSVPAVLASLRWSTRGDDEARLAARDHVRTTLERMRDGGLRDAVGGSFHRYTVDADWRIPHFEKTLYDNAQLAMLYLEASQRLARPELAATARAVLDDLLAHWQAPGGGFVVGFDADDAGGEGHFYTWTPAELAAALDADAAAAVAQAFGVAAPGELDGRSVLRRTAGIEPSVVVTAEAALPLLARARGSRPAPAIDDKVLVAWNALAIEALLDGARVLDEPRYLEAAVATAAFLRTHATKGELVRRGVKAGVDLGEGFADDHAMLAHALVRLHGATGELTPLREAHRLALVLLRDFWDGQRGGVRRGRGERSDLPITTLDMDDAATPAAGAVTAALWLELGALLGDDALYARGEEILSRWHARAVEHPLGSGALLSAIDAHTAGVFELVIAGEPTDPATLALLAVVRGADPTRVLLARVGPEGVDASDAQSWPALANKRAGGGKPTAYLCTRGSCSAPTTDPAQLRAQLAAKHLLLGTAK